MKVPCMYPSDEWSFGVLGIVTVIVHWLPFHFLLEFLTMASTIFTLLGGVLHFMVLVMDMCCHIVVVSYVS